MHTLKFFLPILSNNDAIAVWEEGRDRKFPAQKVWLEFFAPQLHA